MSPRVAPRTGAYRPTSSSTIPTTEAERAIERAERENRDRSSYAKWAAARRPNETRSTRERAAISFATPVSETAFWNYVTSRTVGDAKHMLDIEEQRALSRATGAAGNFLVPSDFYDEVAAARSAAGVLGQIARVIETDHGRTLPLPTATGHGTASWTAENTGYPSTSQDETFAQASLSAHKATTKLFVSEELVQDSAVALDQYLAAELGRRLAAIEETAFAVGDGTAKPLGIAHASSGISTVTAATGSTTAFKLADLKAVYKALPVAYRPTASWLLNPDDYAELAALTDSAGGLVLPSLSTDTPTLFGRPVYLHPDLPTPAASARSAAFGDWNLAYAVRRVRGLGLQRLDELASDNGQFIYQSRTRVDGRPVLTDAARILVHSAT